MQQVLCHLQVSSVTSQPPVQLRLPTGSHLQMFLQTAPFTPFCLLLVFAHHITTPPPTTTPTAPKQVVVREEARHWYHFLTTTCAIIGGVFTVAGILDSILYQAGKFSKKLELGKQG